MNQQMPPIKSRKLTEVLPKLERIAKEYGFRLNRPQEFRLARKIFAIRYYNTPNIYDVF